MSDLQRRASGETRVPEGPTLDQQIRQMESQFALAMPKGMEAAQIVRDALTMLRTNPKLGECDPKSVLGSLMTCSQLGLRPGVLGHAWLLPFWDNRSKGFKAQLVIGYQGLVELAHRSGRIKSLVARTVYANDTFDVDYGLTDNLVHKPNLKGDRGEPTGYYAIVKFQPEGHVFYYMTHEEMEKYRDRFAMAKARDGKIVGPWVDHFEGMAHKTVVRQLAKWMPKSTDLATALEVDEGVRINYDPNTDAANTTHHYADQIPPNGGDTVPGEVAPTDPSEEGTTLDGRSTLAKQLNQALADAGFPDEDERQGEYVSRILGRTITNKREITVGDAQLIIDATREALEQPFEEPK
jgi:recombination protein RecT